MPPALFLNPWLLPGLLGIALPIIAHLLSRRKFDVVDWGAMQFLNPSRRTRRRLRLEELLLLLIRIGMIAIIVMALARPAINSGFLLGYQSSGSREVVIVIDSSNTMSRTDGLTTVHQKAIRQAQKYVDTLGAGDAIAIVDARDESVSIVSTPVQDREVVSQALKDILPPAGAGNMRTACETAIGILSRGSRARREVVVFTDRQRAGWGVESEQAWKRYDELLKFPSIRPNVWVVNSAEGLAPLTQNVSVGKIELSRDLTVPNFPIPFQVAIRNAGNGPIDVPVQVAVNGQRLPNLDGKVTVPAQGEVTVSRTLRFQTEGTNLVTVTAALEQDAIRRDNESHAAVGVSSAIPVLLVDGSNDLRKSRWSTYFAELALTAPNNAAPWIDAGSVKASELTESDLDSCRAVVLSDVTQLPEGLSVKLVQFAKAGNGILISSGKNSTPESFRQLYGETGLLPFVKIVRTRIALADAVTATTIGPYSLKAGWLDRFREDKGASLLKAAFREWWLVDTSTRTETSVAQDELEDPPEGSIESNDGRTPPAVIAQLTTGDPLLLQTKVGEGSVLLMTSTLDTSWNSLPTQPDYVPFIHEALFQLVSSSIKRNVEFGAPLLTQYTGGEDSTAGFQFDGPFEQQFDAASSKHGDSTTIRLDSGPIPGIFKARSLSSGEIVDSFVVNYDHSEDNPAGLSKDDEERLQQHNRMSLVNSTASLSQQMYGDESQSELWWLLLAGFLLLIVAEVALTRRLVLQGHAGAD